LQASGPVAKHKKCFSGPVTKSSGRLADRNGNKNKEELKTIVSFGALLNTV